MIAVSVFAIAALAVLLWDTNDRARRAIAALDSVDLRLASAIRRLARRQSALETRLTAGGEKAILDLPATERAVAEETLSGTEP